MIAAPCKGCSHRYVGCHSICPEYKVFRAERDRIIEERAKEYPGESYVCDISKRVNKSMLHTYEKRGRKPY